MKCPKCGYVGFESVDKCRNCGYHFSLADNPPDFDLGLDADKSLADPLDLDLRTGDAPAAEGGDGDAPVPADGAAPRTLRGRANQPASGFPRDTPENQSGTGIATELPLFGPDGLPGVTPERGSVQVSAVTDALRRKPVADTPASGGAVSPPPGGPRMRPRAEAQYRPPALALEPEASTGAVPLRRRGPSSGPLLAGGVARAIAAVLDTLILGGLDLGVLYFTLRVCRLAFTDIALLPPAPLVGFFVLLDGAYLVAFTAHGGQTIGKMATGIRVIGEDGTPVIATQSMVRAAGYLASLLPAGLGLVPAFFGPSRRALHDRLANTRVIKG